MSIRVKARLNRLNILTTHEERVEIDREIERRTNVYCDTGIDKISDDELKEIVELVRRRRKRSQSNQDDHSDSNIRYGQNLPPIIAMMKDGNQAFKKMQILWFRSS